MVLDIIMPKNVFFFTLGGGVLERSVESSSLWWATFLKWLKNYIEEKFLLGAIFSNVRQKTIP